MSSINADRYVESDVNKQIFDVDANKLYGMQSVKIFLPVNSKHYRFRENTNKNILNRKTWKVYYNVQMTTDNQDGFFMECDLKVPPGNQRKDS